MEDALVIVFVGEYINHIARVFEECSRNNRGVRMTICKVWDVLRTYQMDDRGWLRAA